MLTSKPIRNAVRCALCSGAAMAASLTMLPTVAALAGDTIQEVVVTGSRIVPPNLSTSPVMQLTAEDIATQGVTRVEDAINQLPLAFADQNATVANGATGTATVNLRGLGSERTLVLIDGRRMPYGSVTGSAADLNQIPAALVERIEVLTGGASAVYGSDAVAGVVNFIMKKDFEGIQIDGQYGVYQHKNDYGGPGAVPLRTVIQNRAVTNPAQFKLPSESGTDGDGRQGSIVMGLNSHDGRGNITAYVVYGQNNEILQANRDFSACSLGSNPTNSFSCGGSATAVPGTFTQDFATNYTISDNQFRPFVDATDQFNTGPANHFLRPDERYSLGANGHYQLSDHADGYMQLMFADDRSVAQIAPGGVFFDTSTINCDNPLLSAQQLATLGCDAAAIASGDSVDLFIGRRNGEGGGRQDDFHSNAFRGLLGVRGDFATGWAYDVSTQFSRVTADAQALNFFSKARLTRALDVVSNNGVPTCRSVVNGSDPNCVPYNIFSEGGVTAAALNYLYAPGIQTGVIDQSVFLGVITGDLGELGVKLPAASDAVQIAFGAEQRRDDLANTTDDLLTSDGLTGTAGAKISLSGATHVDDYFAEASIPIVQDKPLAAQLGLQLAYRYSDYGDLTTDTYKISGDWAPLSAVRFRASLQRAVRAANIIELFSAQQFNLFDLDGDPCGAADRNPNATAAECIATGVPAGSVDSPALDNPSGQYQFLQGGNPALTPEKSETVAFGVVFAPGFAPGLNVAIDYFDIQIDNTIAVFGAENTLEACYTSNDAAACSRIHRNAFGQLWITDGHVANLDINIGSLQTRGVDLNLVYGSPEMGAFGSLNFSVTGTYLDALKVAPGPGIAPYDCKGFFGPSCAVPNGAPNPEWRHLARIGWSTSWKVDVALSWRYFGRVEQLDAAANRIDRRFSAQSYFDVYGSWGVTDNATLRIGMNNVLDSDPPLNASVGTTGNGNTYPQTYDALGRFIFTGLTIKL